MKFQSRKEEKLFQNLLKVTEQFIFGKSFVSLTESEFRERLKIIPQHVELFHDVLEQLMEQGKIELKNQHYRLKSGESDIISGILRVHPRGFGFLQPETSNQYTQDIFIPKHLTKNAVDGDRVEAIITDSSSEKGPEGKVITILNRSRTHIAGIIRSILPNGIILAYVPLLGTAQRVIVEKSDEFDLKSGDRVVMEVTDWGSKETETICKVSHYIGHISDASCDIKAAIEEYELRDNFPSSVIQEAKKFGRQVSIQEIKNREDLRDIECFTIDPDTAKDFDDAISLTKDVAGHYHLGVHISDVSYYVQPDSSLDLEAKERCNSTYFPGVCIPMLPQELSNHLCSLKPNVNRLTVTVFVDFDQQGNQLSYRICRSVIKSRKRFTYREAKLILENKKKSRYAPTLKLMVELCELLKRKRYERGSIEFAIPELVVIVDENGVPLKTEQVIYDISHQLVEEFMLKANEIVALHLSEQGKDLTYRVHDLPSEENIKDFTYLAYAFGYQLPQKPTPKDFQKLFDEALQTPYGQYLATSYIRRMRLAVYSVDNIGHYGLGLSHYCHFTSPIRRYVDLVVHRILFSKTIHARAELDQVSLRCSEQERISTRAESHVVLLKKLRLLEEIHKTNPRKEYEAIVTTIKPFGVYFEVLEFMLEGFLHVSDLSNDFYIYDEVKTLLRGRRTGEIFSSGEKISVLLKKIDFIALETEWDFVALELPQEKPKIKPSVKEIKKLERKPFAPIKTLGSKKSLHKKKKSKR